MESSAIARYTPRKSKKRVFPGSSTSCSEPDVIEIDPPFTDQSSKPKAIGIQKEVLFHEIIDVDMDEECTDRVLLGGKVESNKKMKGVMGVSLVPSSVSKLDAKKGVSNKKGKDIPESSKTKSFNPGSNNFFDLDDYVFDDDYTQTGSSSHLSNNFNTQVAVNIQSRLSSRVAGTSSSMAKPLDDVAMKKYRSFKKFDTVTDHSDHYYANTKPPKNCSKKIQEDWRILEKDLPDTIFVRVYESRMDLLRAVIIGAEGTPYHDGLFFFDVCFPSSYPRSPPLVHYHSGGLRINPNLYNCGKVCLSLLNTWTGGQKEKWIPGTSTMLQVLVSIQGLILNTKPFFNEPGYANWSGSVHGEESSLRYNENTVILSLKTMVYAMNNPPKNFEDLVVGHFRNRVLDILMACKAYTEGVQVGCLVKGGVQDVDEGNNSCSSGFKNNVASYVTTLIAAFKKIGAKEAEEFLHLSAKKSSLTAAPTANPSVIGYPPFIPGYIQH